MRIAFDLDDTLIPTYPDSFPVEEPRSWWGKWLAKEPFRLGSRALLQALSRRCELWVYTSSLRSPFYIHLLFRCYGARLTRAINYEVHCQWLRKQPRHLHCSKYPPEYGIDLLIDDSEGVKMEGDRLGFRVLHLRPDEENWTGRILEEVNTRLSVPIVLD